MSDTLFILRKCLIVPPFLLKNENIWNPCSVFVSFMLYHKFEHFSEAQCFKKSLLHNLMLDNVTSVTSLIIHWQYHSLTHRLPVMWKYELQLCIWDCRYILKWLHSYNTSKHRCQTWQRTVCTQNHCSKSYVINWNEHSCS